MKIQTWLAPTIVVALLEATVFLDSTVSRADTMQVHATRLRSAGDVADAAAAHSAMLALQTAAKTCSLSDLKTRIECVCNLKPELATMKSAYATVATKHPAWIKPNTAFSYIDPNNGEWVIITFANAGNSVLGMCRAK